MSKRATLRFGSVYVDSRSDSPAFPLLLPFPFLSSPTSLPRSLARLFSGIHSAARMLAACLSQRAVAIVARKLAASYCGRGAGRTTRVGSPQHATVVCVMLDGWMDDDDGGDGAIVSGGDSVIAVLD